MQFFRLPRLREELHRSGYSRTAWVRCRQDLLLDRGSSEIVPGITKVRMTQTTTQIVIAVFLLLPLYSSLLVIEQSASEVLPTPHIWEQTVGL